MAKFVTILGFNQQPKINLRSTCVAALCSLPLTAGIGCAQETTTPALEKTDAYSLFVNNGQNREQGYFPMGFAHGSNERAVSLGFSLQQGLSSAAAGFAQTGSLPVPNASEDDPFSLRVGMRNLSMARPAEALGGLLKSAGSSNRLPFKSAKYGEFQVTYTADGKPRTTGGFASINLFDGPTRLYLLDYAREHVRVRTENNELGKSVSLWGLDNEWEGTLDYSPQALAAFKPWLEKAYVGHIEQLNSAWKTSYKNFDEAIATKMPTDQEYKTKPAMFLDWMTFQSENFAGMIAQMAQAMHNQDPLKRGVILKSTQQTIEMPVVNRTKTFDQALLGDLIRPYSAGLLGIDIYGSGDREAYELNYVANCIRPNNYWTNNTNGDYGVFLGEGNNHSGPGHQFASTFWRMLPNGLKGVNYFTLGFAGAQHDWDTFGFTNPKTGQPKDKLYYAARWANMVHRTEKFWTQSRPVAGMSRVALLMPRRDVLLSDKDPKGSKWAYPENNRWMLYRWLREQGYWVDVIPYTKLNADYLRGYQGLFLVGAEHLSAQENTIISNYVQAGGTLVADSRVGYWDEHHHVTNSIKPLLGVNFPNYVPNAPIAEGKFEFEKTTLFVRGVLPVIATTASVVSKANQPTSYLNKVGQGRVLYFPFELGAISTETEAQALARVEAQGPTADNEEYSAFAAEFAPAQWLGSALKNTSLTPAYRVVNETAAVSGKMRIEQPVVDESGNCAVVVSNRAQSQQEILPATTAEISLPEGNWQTATWAAAEDDCLQEVKLTKMGASYQIGLPSIRTTGVLYLFKESAPLLGIAQIVGNGKAIDGATAQVKTGTPFKVAVQLFNPNGQALPAGSLKIQADDGWKVTPATLTTNNLNAGGKSTFEFEVTPESNDALIKPNWLYPVIAKWEQNGQSKAVITANVEVVTDPKKSLKVLSDNSFYPDTYTNIIKTGATYSYLNPAQVADPASHKTATGQALTNGFGAGNIGARSSSRTQPKNFARFNSTSGEILFDLKKLYRVQQLVFVPGPGANTPTNVQILTSEDGQNFTPQTEVAPSGPRQKIRTPLFDSQARYVSAKVTWAASGGTLDEVEVFGVATP